MEHQDWEPVVFNKKKTRTTGSRAVNQARRTGGAVETTSKYGAGKNIQHGGGHTTKLDKAGTGALDEDTESMRLKKVSLTVSTAIQKARQTKGWNQKELGMRVNEKQAVIASYEQGKAVPSQQVLGKLERQLGVRLRGKNIGEPFTRGKKKGK